MSSSGCTVVRTSALFVVAISLQCRERCLERRHDPLPVQRVQVLVGVVDEHQQWLFEQRVRVGVRLDQGLGAGCEESDRGVL